MLVMQLREGRYRPRLLCDVCQQPIRLEAGGLGRGAAHATSLLDPTDGSEEGDLEVKVVHDRCLPAAEKALGGRTGFHNLDVFLAHLLHNVGYTNAVRVTAEKVARLLEGFS